MNTRQLARTPQKVADSARQSGFTVSAWRQEWYLRIADKRQSTGYAGPGSRQTGFTIVELMIATLVFSVILLVITYGVLRFTSAYYKGVNSSTTQDTARSVMDTVSQAIQFSGTQIVPTDGIGGTGGGYFCAGGQIYVFKTGVPYDGAAPTASQPGLYVTADNGSCNFAAVTYGTGKELLGKNMRLVYLSVNNLSGQTYTVSVRLAYASGGGAVDGNDLLCAPTAQPGSCTSATVLTDAQLAAAGNDVICKLQTGSQFCAVSALSTTVLRRVTGS